MTSWVVTAFDKRLGKRVLIRERKSEHEACVLVDSYLANPPCNELSEFRAHHMDYVEPHTGEVVRSAHYD